MLYPNLAQAMMIGVTAMQMIHEIRFMAFAKSVSVAIFLVLASMWAGPSHAADTEYRLGSGDKVKVTVFGEADLSGDYEISASGGVAFPLVGEIAAGGGTARDLEKRIAAKLRDGYLKNPTVSVEVLSYRPFFIMGEVKRPGSYPYKAGLNLLNATALAGGYTYRAKSSLWVITRVGDKNIQEKEIKDGDFIVRPGDTIVVPERFF